MPPANEIAASAAQLVNNARANTHGDKRKNHQNIATMWNAYRSIRRYPERNLDETDVAIMMVLLKIARTQLGDHNPDDYVDMVGYASIAGELAQ